ncbi:hypothetical protein KQX54_006151 [Cotesia glomerata]|uniref:Secreted protein n=1 Tax=Cotesia glomerata TaxID=32391 RepID=A0AAV7I1X8_COTGL|nr:hypothetical protein KQX54_006151 [Cotesia glomerata]
MSGICCLSFWFSVRSLRCLWLTGYFDLPNTYWFLELAFEFPGTQPLAQGRVNRGSATRVYIRLLGRCPYSSLADSGWRGNGFPIGPGAPTLPSTVFGWRAPLRRIAIPEMLTWR